MTRTIIFHIGLEKTGTSSFQRFCMEHHRTLLARGVLYPVKTPAFARSNHERLARSYLPYHDFSAGRARRPRPALLRSLHTAIAKASPDVVLISSEHFSSRFREEQIRALAADFADYNCQIAVVVRDHLSHLRSAYSQTVASGRALTFDAYCDEVFERGNRYLRYKETIGAWESSFGRANIRVLPYGRGVDIVGRLCEAVIPQAAMGHETRTYWQNRSLDAHSIEMLRRANAALYGDRTRRQIEDNYFQWLLLRYAQAAVRAYVAITAGGRPQGQLRLSERNLRRLRVLAAVDNPWLESRYGVRLTEPNEVTDQVSVPAWGTSDVPAIVGEFARSWALDRPVRRSP